MEGKIAKVSFPNTLNLQRERRRRNTQKKIAPELFKENQSIDDFLFFVSAAKINLFCEIDVPPNYSDDDFFRFFLLIFRARERRDMSFLSGHVLFRFFLLMIIFFYGDSSFADQYTLIENNPFKYFCVQISFKLNQPEDG
uniref:(northern house mosquito) hypothetical protein n=1 Tax=Culex pipiens TaxID=7175 RepID=A0A8D8AWE3_CULPI